MRAAPPPIKARDRYAPDFNYCYAPPSPSGPSPPPPPSRHFALGARSEQKGHLSWLCEREPVCPWNFSFRNLHAGSELPRETNVKRTARHERRARASDSSLTEPRQSRFEGRTRSPPLSPELTKSVNYSRRLTQIRNARVARGAPARVKRETRGDWQIAPRRGYRIGIVPARCRRDVGAVRLWATGRASTCNVPLEYVGCISLHKRRRVC